MDEKKMTLEELVGWLDDNDVSYEVDDAGRLTVNGDLIARFRNWAKIYKYTSLPDEFVRVDGALWLEQTSIVSLGNLTSVEGELYLQKTPLNSLGNLTFVGWDLMLQDTSITSLGNLISVGGGLDLQNTHITSLDNLPQVGGLHLDRDQFQLLTREVLRKVAGGILYWGLAENKWVALSPDELETIVAENERRESLHSVRESDVDWDLYDR